MSDNTNLPSVQAEDDADIQAVQKPYVRLEAGRHSPVNVDLANSFWEETKLKHNAFLNMLERRALKDDIKQSKYLGHYVDLDSLIAAIPEPTPGDYADVDAGEGSPVVRYIWDETDQKWEAQVGVSTQLTGAQIKEMYEGEGNVNSFTDAEKEKLSNLGDYGGTFESYEDLVNNTDYAKLNSGSYAIVDPGIGFDSIFYIWDTTDEKWVKASFGGESPRDNTFHADNMLPGQRRTWDGSFTEQDAVVVNLPALGGNLANQRSWHAETIGVTGRIVMTATEVLGLGTSRGRSFIRVKHDTTWYPWQEVYTTGNDSRIRIGSIGKAGRAGFGVGVAPGHINLSERGLTPIPGHDDPMSNTYGNYLHTDDSVMCFIPKFFYRIGSPDSPVFNRFNANSIDIVGSETFSNETEANAAGYTLHRAFIDGGVEQDGFFYDKYFNSKNPSNMNTSISVKGGIPISLTTNSGFTRSQGMTGCVGQLLDAFPLVKARGDNFFVTTIFMRSALAMISLCHGQYATGPSYCAWYDSAGNTNYPKGANNNNLRDVDDTEVLYTSAGDSGADAKPRTGSGVPFNKTTHNGQGCGVADLNGCMWEVNIGITRMGADAGPSDNTSNDDLFILKESEKAGDLTNGWDGPTDTWGTEANLLLKYDKVEHQIPQATEGWGIKWGNGGQQVLSSSKDGASRALCGVIPDLPSQVSATGINLFGVDGIFRHRRQNLFVHSGGTWNNGSESGVWSRAFLSWRAISRHRSSFRAATF